MNCEYGKTAPQDSTSGVRGEKEGRYAYAHAYCYRKIRRGGGKNAYQQKRIGGKVRKRGSKRRGVPDIGGTISQLIDDCKEQLAVNEQIIGTLHKSNESLREKIDLYQRIVARVRDGE